MKKLSILLFIPTFVYSASGEIEKTSSLKIASTYSSGEKFRGNPLMLSDSILVDPPTIIRQTKLKKPTEKIIIYDIPTLLTLPRDNIFEPR